MFYRLVQCWIRAGLLIYFRRVKFTDPAVLKEKGPLLLACNHPNSFLDAIVVGSHFRRPVHFLARGDAFRHPLASRLLRALKMIPIYRLSEGREHLALNDATFEQCQQILRQGGIVLIFSEGLCRHQWNLRPLKKGTARIVFYRSDRQELPAGLRVVAAGLNYTVFGKMERRVLISTGKPYSPYTRDGVPETEAIRNFNLTLSRELQQNLLEAKDDVPVLRSLLNNLSWAKASPGTIPLLEKQREMLHRDGIGKADAFRPPIFFTRNAWKTIGHCLLILLLAPAALLSFVFHAPLYVVLRRLTRKKTTGTVFYDSVLFGLLLITYPFYWGVALLVSWLAPVSPLFSVLLFAMPLLAFLHGIFDTSVKRVAGTLLSPAPALRLSRSVMASTNLV